MNYDIEAIPTKYDGVLFRSQLEARWAHLFNQIGLGWEYEPCLLSGWFPDFRLEKWFVEVKPVEPDGFSMANDNYEAFKKAFSHDEVILLGNGPGFYFGCIAGGGPSRGEVWAQTIFYDPGHRDKIRSVEGDGGSDPCLRNLEKHWQISCDAIGFRQRQKRRAFTAKRGVRRCMQ